MTTTFFLGIDHPALGRRAIPLEIGAEIEHILAWLAATYGQVQDGTDGEGKPIMRDRTPMELLRCLAEATAMGHAASVERFLQDRAAAAARAAVRSIDVVVGEPIEG